MDLLKLFIYRKVVSIAIAALIVIFGIFGLIHMPIRLFPQITRPVIDVTTVYPGASSEVVRSFVTSKLESALTGLPNIDYLSSSSSKSQSEIRVHLLPDSDVNTALTRVSEQVNAELSELPDGVRAPTIEAGSDDDSPVLILAFTSSKMPRVQIAEYLRRVVAPQFETLDGVSEAQILGPKYVVRIELNPALLAAHQLTASDVLAALKNQNVLSQTGDLEGTESNLEVNVKSNIESVNAFNHLLIQSSNGKNVYLSDVGIAKFNADTDAINAYYNGKSAVMMFITLSPGANPLTIAKTGLVQLNLIKQKLPYDMKADVVLDLSQFIRASIHEVIVSLLVAFAVILLVLLFFLGSWRTMLIPFMTIPISLLGCNFIMYLMGYSINTLTLLALVLAIGLVVDDAIVIVENIHRHLTKHHITAMKAAYVGTKEVWTVIIVMTLTLAAVFAPVMFMQGIVGKLFSEFAVALAGAVLISGIVALTLTPMMCGTILSHNPESKLAQFSERCMLKLAALYQWILRIILEQRRGIGFIIWIVSIVGCIYLYATTPKLLIPKEDQGFLMVSGEAPESANQNYVLKYAKQLDAIYQQLPGIQNYIYIQGNGSVNSLMSFVLFKSWGERHQSVMQIQPELQKQLNQISGIEAYAVIPGAMPGSSNNPFRFVITSSADYQKLYAVSQQFEKEAMMSGIFNNLTDDLSYHQPELQVEVNRKALIASGVNMVDVVNALSILTGGSDSQQFSFANNSYDVVLEAPKQYRSSPQSLTEMYVRNQAGNLIPLSSLVESRISVVPGSLNGFQKQNAVTISGDLSPGYSMSQALTYAQQLANKILPGDMSYNYAGETRLYVQEGNSFIGIFVLALFVIFLLLGIQFNSFRDAALILLGGVPMAMCCALLPLKLGFGTINIYTQLALLTLVGLISKHGILMTKFANELKHQGQDRLVAIKEAAKVRFRPILMTTVAMAVGAFPLILSSGAGSVSRNQLGIAISVGLLLGTLCTLFVFPVLYTVFSRAQ